MAPAVCSVAYPYPDWAEPAKPLPPHAPTLPLPRRRPSGDCAAAGQGHGGLAAGHRLCAAAPGAALAGGGGCQDQGAVPRSGCPQRGARLGGFRCALPPFPILPLGCFASDHGGALLALCLPLLPRSPASGLPACPLLMGAPSHAPAPHMVPPVPQISASTLPVPSAPRSTPSCPSSSQSSRSWSRRSGLGMGRGGMGRERVQLGVGRSGHDGAAGWIGSHATLGASP